MRRAVALLLLLFASACAGEEPVSITVERRFFVVKKMFFGGVRRDGRPDSQAWKSFGLDLDARITTKEDSKTSVSTCKRVMGSPTGVLADGNLGRDNNFGQYIQPIFTSLGWDFDANVQQELANGEYSFVLRVDVPSQDGPAPGALFVVGPHAGKPTFQRDDRWPRVETRVRDFPHGFVSGGVWAGGLGEPAGGRMWLPMFGPGEVRADVAVEASLGVSGQASMGIAIATSELRGVMIPWLRTRGLCATPGSATEDQFMNSVTLSADLVADAPNFQDATRTCDAISIGIDLELAPVAEPTEVVAPASPPASMCP